jgi:hypothetical protein
LILAALVLSELVLAILLSIEAGYRIGLRRWAGVQPAARMASSTLEASLLGLMGLLVAFIFYGAGSRFDIRRNLIVQEANAIGTAYRRLDLLPAETQPELRDDFRQYVRSRLAIFQKIPDVKAMNVELARSSTLQDKLWKKAVSAAQSSGAATQSLVLSSLNEVIDITTVHSVALITHPPLAVFVLLGVTVLVASGVAGYSMSAAGFRDWVFIVAYSLVLGITIYVILDYEFPRVGLIRVDPVDQVLMRTLAQME